MSNLHRLAWIDARIRAKSFPGSRVIAEKFEISVRQAQRDIEYLKYSMGAPVEYSYARNGYYYTDETFSLPAHFITGEEKRILTYLASQYKTIGRGNTELLAGLFSRLAGDGAVSPGYTGDIPVYNAETEEIEIHDLFQEAAGLCRKVKFHYRNASHESSERIVHPYKVFNKEMVNYVVGFCELRGEIRVFRLSRASRLQVLEESFQVLSHFDEKAYGPQKGFLYKEPYTAIVEFEKPVDTTKFRFQARLADNTACEIYFYNSDEILSELLSQNLSFSIRSPRWLKTKLKDRLDKIILKNS